MNKPGEIEIASFDERYIGRASSGKSKFIVDSDIYFGLIMLATYLQGRAESAHLELPPEIGEILYQAKHVLNAQELRT